jgi:tetratricopeptide (TPR) repeat protein
MLPISASDKIVSFLKAISWSAVWAPRLQSWTMDRNWNRAEGERLLAAHEFKEAEYYLTLAVADADLNSLSSAKRVRLRLQLAEAQRKLDQLGRAEETIRAAAAIAARTSDSNGYLLCLDALAEVFMIQENYTAAEKLSQEGIRIETTLPHPDPLRMARRVHRLGIARYRTSPSADVLPALQKGLELHEAAYGLEHAETARVLSELGAILRAQGHHDDAQRYLRRSLRLHQLKLGHDHPVAVQDLHQLAGSLEESGDIEGAAAEYERMIVLKQRAVGEDPDELAEMQFSLANLYIGWGNFARSRELLADCVGTFKRTSGPRFAVALETLAQVEELSGRFHDAVRELDRAGKVWEKCPGRSTELAANLEYRAELLDQLRKRKEATWLREQAARLAGRAAGA